MENKIVAGVFLLIVANLSHAEEVQQWVQFNAGVRETYGVQFKHTVDGIGWSGGMLSFGQEFIFDTTIDRDSLQRVSPSVKVFEVSRLWTKPYGWGYADFGIGFGVAKGEWATECGYSTNSILFGRECDIENVTTVGIPIHTSFSFGRGAGIGMGLSYFYSSERSYKGFTLAIPLGGFAQ